MTIAPPTADQLRALRWLAKAKAEKRHADVIARGGVFNAQRRAALDDLVARRWARIAKPRAPAQPGTYTITDEGSSVFRGYGGRCPPHRVSAIWRYHLRHITQASPYHRRKAALDHYASHRVMVEQGILHVVIVDGAASYDLTPLGREIITEDIW